MLKKIILLPLCYLLMALMNEYVDAEQEEVSPISYNIQLLHWKMADQILPKYSKFTIIDVETGSIFNVQRRAGSQHADVQPLTVQDTKIMKEVYEGKWSWRRRAIIIMIDDQWLAASMHGMPHGAGALNNQFPGHFCVHFLGSTTHKTDNMDLSHKLMIYKAAGNLKNYLDHLNPNEVTRAFIAGMKEHDEEILSFLSTDNPDWKALLSPIENIKLIKLKDIKEEEYLYETRLVIEIEWNVYIKYREGISESKQVQLIRSSPLEPWKVIGEKVLPF